MTIQDAFWDTSALVTLCVTQHGTARALTLYGQYALTVWWATPVEIASALARLLRLGEIDASAHAKAGKQADGLATTWTVVEPAPPLRLNACALLDLYSLRAADALQLAAALTWCEGTAKGRVFIAADRRLAEAAQASGFLVELI